MNQQLEERKYIIIGFFILVGLAFIARLFYIQVIDDPKNRKIFLVQELMEGGALMPDSEKCDAMTNEVRES